MKKTPDRSATLIDLLIAKAPALREAGVLVIAIGDTRVELAAYAPPIEATTTTRNDDEPDEARDALSDAATYGRGAGVPGFTRPRITHDDGDDA